VFTQVTTFAGQGAFIAVVITLAAALTVGYVLQRRRVRADTYSPRLAWLRAGLYFCFCLLVASASGALAAVVQAPLATAAQLADPAWLALTLACVGVIVLGYAVIWPMGTFTDGRRLHRALSLGYGAAWGLCQGLLFLSMWALIARSGLAVHWVAVLSYLAIGTWNGLWHRFFWDIHVSPPHNYSEWNGRKVLLCHTPNLVICLTHLAIHGNAGIFVLLQGLALAISAYVMRFPAYGDDYRATPGQERSMVEKIVA
jgi:hypothetical protein